MIRAQRKSWWGTHFDFYDSVNKKIGVLIEKNRSEAKTLGFEKYFRRLDLKMHDQKFDVELIGVNKNGESSHRTNLICDFFRYRLYSGEDVIAQAMENRPVDGMQHPAIIKFEEREIEIALKSQMGRDAIVMEKKRPIGTLELKGLMGGKRIISIKEVPTEIQLFCFFIHRCWLGN